LISTAASGVYHVMRVLDVTEMSRIHWTACWKMLVSKELLVKMVCAVVVSYLF